MRNEMLAWLSCRRSKRLQIILGFALVITTIASLSAAPSAREKQRIDALIAAVEKSGLIFIRNGSEYSAAEAASHLRLKLSKAGNRISTAEQFIDYLASKSSITGSPYFLKFPDGRTEQAGPWLHRRLLEIDRRSQSMEK
jgi:hypothetical protein